MQSIDTLFTVCEYALAGQFLSLGIVIGALLQKREDEKMQLEKIVNEANEFDRDDFCYIHVEKTPNKAFDIVLTGDDAVAFQGIYNLLCNFCVRYEMPMRDLLRKFKQVYRAVGYNTANIVGTIEKEEG